MNDQLTDQQLDEYETALRNADRIGSGIAPASAATLLAEVRRLRTRVAELEATSVPDETEYGVRMPGSSNVWPRREFRITHWERVLSEGAVRLQRTIRRGPWTEAPVEETHVVADDSDDPEHVDDCPSCVPAASEEQR